MLNGFNCRQNEIKEKVEIACDIKIARVENQLCGYMVTV